MRMSALPTSRGLIRLVAILPVLGGLAVTGVATKVGPPLLSCAQAATAHHAALVVEHGDGSVITVCVAFDETSITGDQLLSYAHAQAQLQYATASYGGGNGEAVCQIDYEPAQYPPGCWTASSPYWALFVSRGGGSWSDSSLGVSSQTFRDGDAEGFRYEAQSENSAPPSPRGVCPAPPSATPTPVRSATPTAHSAATAARPRPPQTPAAATVAASALPTVVASAPPGPTRSGSATARPPAAIGSTNRSAPLRTVSTGAWAAGALGGVLLVGVAVQLARARRRAGQRPPP